MNITCASYTYSRTAVWRHIQAIIAALLFVFTLCFFTLMFPVEAYADDTLVIAIDPGHGGGESGASGNGIREEEANWKIAQACVDELNEKYNGIHAVLTRTYSQRMDRQERILSAKAQGASVVISIHCNSSTSSSAHGAEVWIPNDSAYLYDFAHVQGYELGQTILNKLESLGITKRGVYTKSQDPDDDPDYYPEPGGIADWYGINYWARINGMCGIIVEHAFLSNSDDAEYLKTDAACATLGIADAQAIASYYGLSLKSEAETPTPEPEPEPTDPEPEDTSITSIGESVVTQVESPLSDDPTIMGGSMTSVADMVTVYERTGKTYPATVYSQYGAATINEFCQILWEEALSEGVRAEVVFCQAMKETGWLQFGGQVSASQCNFAGIGAVDGGSGGADFSSYGEDSVRIGLRAQVQHLKAYASTDPLVNQQVDPRFHLVTRGVAPTVGGLAGRWASDQNYGESLAKLINNLLSTSFSLKNVTGTPQLYVDGELQEFRTKDGYGLVSLSGEQLHVIVAIDENTVSVDPHAVYPVGMKVWLASYDNGAYTVNRYYGFDDLLQYAGSSIRITGNQGIRLITGMSQEVKSLLTTNGLNGWKLKETGTLLAWSDKVENGNLTFETSGVSHGRAYVAGVQDPIFQENSQVAQYTNVLVGFQLSQCSRDLSMRPYATLCNSNGDEIIIYGGCVQRSIGYIAQQNANAFQEGTSAYEFVHAIIDACQ